MPDWEKLICDRLGRLDLPPHEQAEVITELAAHMDDDYEALRTQGVAESEAIRRALETVAWRGLARKIERSKEGEMNQRTRKLWIPGLFSLLTASGSLAVLLWVSMQSRFVWLPKAAFLGWILLLPLSGALGAYLSRRAGGERTSRILAGVFPSITLFVALAIVFVVALFVERNRFVLEHPAGVLVPFLGWIVMPAVSLAVGTVPFLRGQEKAAIMQSRET